MVGWTNITNPTLALPGQKQAGPSGTANNFWFSGNHIDNGRLHSLYLGVGVDIIDPTTGEPTTGNNGLVLPSNGGSADSFDFYPDGYVDMFYDPVSQTRRYKRYTTYGSALTMSFVNSASSVTDTNPWAALIDGNVTSGPGCFGPGQAVDVYVFPIQGDPNNTPPLGSPDGSFWNDSTLRRVWGCKHIRVPADGKKHTLKHYMSNRAFFGTSKALDDMYYAGDTNVATGIPNNLFDLGYGWCWQVVMICAGYPYVALYEQGQSNVEQPGWATPSLQVELQQTFYWKCWNLDYNAGYAPMSAKNPNLAAFNEQRVKEKQELQRHLRQPPEGPEDEEDFVEIEKSPSTPSTPTGQMSKVSIGTPTVQAALPKVGQSPVSAKTAMANRLKLLRQLPQGLGRRLAAPSSPQRMDIDPSSGASKNK